MAVKAKSRAVTTRVVSPKVAVVRVPGSSPARRGARSALRRGAGRVAAAARDEKHTLTAIAAAAGLGLAKREGVELPKIDALGTPGTYGIGAFMLARLTKSRVMSHVATGLLSVAAYELTSASDDAAEGDGW